MTTIQMPRHKTRHSLNAAVQFVGGIISTLRSPARTTRGASRSGAALMRSDNYAATLSAEQQGAVLVGHAAVTFLSSDERALRLAA
jgi:hypothetical protein